VPGTAAPRLPERSGSAVATFAPADVMAIRRLLEPPAMSLAVAWATSAALDKVDRCLAGGDRAASYEEFEAWDLALHRCIIAATHSPLLATLYEAIETARHGQVWGDLKRRSATPERRQEYQIDHHELVAALRARDPARAMEAMRLHLARVSGHLNATDPAAGITWRGGPVGVLAEPGRRNGRSAARPPALVSSSCSRARPARGEARRTG
jgi:DNA-binding FadR family transcriptional regulator